MGLQINRKMDLTGRMGKKMFLNKVITMVFSDTCDFNCIDLIIN